MSAATPAHATRFISGLLLWSAAQCAAAADEPSLAPSARTVQPTPALVPAWRNTSTLRTRPVARPAALLLGDVQIARAMLHADPRVVAEAELTRLLEFSVDRRVLGALRDGIGVRVGMGYRGGLHLNLYSRRNPKGPGQRWSLNPAGADAATSGPRLWSLGGSFDLVRTGDGGRQVVFVPQLLLDFDALGPSDYRCQAVIQYAHWRATPGEATMDEGVPQASFKLRF